MPRLLAALLAASALFTAAIHAANPAPPAASRPAAPPAIHWQHTLSEVVVASTDASGKNVGQLNLGVLDYFLQTISDYSESDAAALNDARRIDVINKLSRLTMLLTELDQGGSADVNILRREALAYNLAYNLGYSKEQQPADALYQRLLKQDPDEPATNFLYGAFLAQADATRGQSIAYLDKALKLGVKKANFTLGLVYITQSKDKQALACLQQYSADYPEDQRAKRLIAAVKSGDIKRQYHP